MLRDYKIYHDDYIGFEGKKINGGHHPIHDFLSFKNIVHQRLPEIDDNPLLDQILYQTEKAGRKKILLIISVWSLPRFDESPSQIKKFIRLIKQGLIKLVIHNPLDTLYNLSNLFFSSAPGCQRVYEILRQVPCVIFTEGKIDRKIKEHYTDASFIENLNYCQFDNLWTFPEIFSQIKTHHETDRNHTFFTTFLNHKKRPQRRYLADQLNSRIFDKAILKIGEWKNAESASTATDIDQCGYGENWVNSIGLHKKILPNLNFYNSTNYELVVEGLGFDNDESFGLSEKILKPIYMDHPFLVVSNKHFLMNLRSLGFKTFDGLIDESYDEMDKHTDRVDAVLSVIDQLNLKKSRELYQESKEIRLHNQNTFYQLIGANKTLAWQKYQLFFDSFLTKS